MAEPTTRRYRTPLRYPGGKQRLWPFVAEILQTNALDGGDYVEPYAGGAGVAMELLLRDLVGVVHLNDSSKAVHSFWYAILHHTDLFCERIEDAVLTIDEWLTQREILRNPDRFTSLDLGFALFYLNRTNRSGIPSGGVIGGLKQAGTWKIDARFPKTELIERIRAISAQKKRIKLKNWDAERFISEYVPKLPEQTLVYLDPPYYEQGHRLYLSRYKPEDHAHLAAVIQEQLTRPWIVSYDGVPAILGLYADRRSFLYDLQYNAQTVRKGKEVFVFGDTVELPDSSNVRAINEVILESQIFGCKVSA